MPDHMRRDEKATTSSAGPTSTGRVAASATSIGSPSPDEAPYAAAVSARSSASMPGAGTSSTTRRASSVRVPVLSRQSTSVALSDSIAEICCASAPRRAIRSVETA